MKKLNDKGLAPIIIILIIAAALIAGGAVYYIAKQKSSAPAPQAQPQANQQATTTDETANWKTYKNDQYGFGFKYPPYTKVQETVNTNKNVLIKLNQPDNPSFGVEIIPKENLSLGGLNSPGTFYSRDLDVWLRGSWGPEDNLYSITCDTSLLGSQKLPTVVDGGGDVGYWSKMNAILTDKSFAIVIRTSGDSNGPSIEEGTKVINNVLDSFQLVGDVHVHNTQCSIPVSDLPTVVSPVLNDQIYYSKPLVINFSPKLAPDVGALAYWDRTNSAYLGKTTGGSSLALNLTDNFFFRPMAINDFKKNGNATLLVKFYRAVEGKKILLGDSYNQNISVTFANDLPYSFSANILSDPQGRWYVDPDGTIVLVNTNTSSTDLNRNVFFEGIVDVAASNVYGCLIHSPWGDNATNFNSLADLGGHYAYGVDVRNINSGPLPSTPFTQDFSCHAPDGTLLHKAFNYRVK